MIMDSSAAEQDFGWRPEIAIDDLLEEIAAHAEANPDWLEKSGV
jgi:nucleoside-diphosphate-sugar epimerase